MTKGKKGGIFNDKIEVHTAPSGTQYIEVEDVRRGIDEDMLEMAKDYLRWVRESKKQEEDSKD